MRLLVRVITVKGFGFRLGYVSMDVVHTPHTVKVPYPRTYGALEEALESQEWGPMSNPSRYGSGFWELLSGKLDEA